MSRDNPFSMHRQKVWEERSANTDLLLWIRVTALAFGCHRANGHANFKAGEIAEILGTPGEPLRQQSVSRAIRLAKNNGGSPGSRPPGAWWCRPTRCMAALVTRMIGAPSTARMCRELTWQVKAFNLPG